MLRTLERLERRTAEVLYRKQQWFKRVRGLEDEEEAHRENEKKKIKKEAALFKRYWKEVTARMEQLRANEDERRQAEYLDQAYKERISQLEDDDDRWDPIEDAIEDERGNYVELIRHFLWGESVSQKTAEAPKPQPLSSKADNNQSQPTARVQTKSEVQENVARPAKSSKATKNKNKKPKNSDQAPEVPGQVEIETKAAMRKRLKEGMEYEHGSGWVLRGTLENPTETMWKTVPVPDDEIDKLLEEILDIKHLLFCRLLLAHAALLPAALRAASVEDFLQDESVTDTDLRDICLKMEQPGLQELRDACADLGRTEEEEDGTNDDETRRVAPKPKGRPLHRRLKTAIPKTWVSKREKELQGHRKQAMELENGAGFVDFGHIDDEGQYRIRKIRVRVCGRYIYDYPSEKAMLRGGWLQFSIMAKGSSLFDVMALCRNWDEFFELTILASFQYFPTSNWATWVGDRKRQQLLQLVPPLLRYSYRLTSFDWYI